MIVARCMPLLLTRIEHGLRSAPLPVPRAGVCGLECLRHPFLPSAAAPAGLDALL